MDNQPNIRKIVLFFAGGILFIILLTWFWHFLHTGKIIITTDNKYNSITLTKITNGNISGGNNVKPPQTYKAHSKLTVAVATGQYVVSVEGNSLATTQVIKLSSHKTLTYNINPIDTTGVEPVAYQSAQNIVVDNKQLLYLDSTNILYKIDNQNNLTLIDPAQQFQAVRWANTSFGVGQDSNGKLYVISNGSASLLTVPFSYDSSDVNFDVSPNKQIYVSHGADVYVGSQNGGFRKIYTAPFASPILVAGADRVAVAVETEGPGASSTPSLSTVSATGKASKLGIDVRNLKWSPNGKYLVSVNETFPTIYDASLHKVTVIQASSFVGQMAWLDNTKLFYASNDELWLYDLANQKAELIANMPLADTITNLSISDDGSYVYVVTVDPSSSNSAIRRVGLRGQKVPDLVYKLQDILPEDNTDAGYSLGLINFTGKPKVMVTGSFNSPADSQQIASQELQSEGFNLSQLNLVTVAQGD